MIFVCVKAIQYFYCWRMLATCRTTNSCVATAACCRL